MTHLRTAGAAAALLTLILAAPVAADTVEGPMGDRIVAGAGFEYSDGGQTWFAGSDVIADHLAGTITISASYFTSTPVTCPGDDPADPGDDYDASIEIGFFADAPADSFEFGDKLSSATASGTVSGDITRFDPCTSTTEVIGQDSIDVTIDLSAVEKVESSVTHDTGVDEDGSRFVFIMRSSVRSADGTITFDGDSHQAGGVIQSQWWRTPVGG